MGWARLACERGGAAAQQAGVAATAPVTTGGKTSSSARVGAVGQVASLLVVEQALKHLGVVRADVRWRASHRQGAGDGVGCREAQRPEKQIVHPTHVQLLCVILFG